MASHINLPITITVKAVDMHLVDKSVKEIYIGDRVHVNSLPHNIVDYLTCTKIEYDLDNPANDTYTFGNPRQTMTERYRILFDENTAICALTEAETAAFPSSGSTWLEIKCLDENGYTVFFDRFSVRIEPRKDKGIKLTEDE